MKLLLLLAFSFAKVHGAIPDSFSYQTVGTAFPNSTSSCAFPILNQQVCGSCYSFATSHTLGTSLCVAIGASNGGQEWLSFSPQQVLNLNYASQPADAWANDHNPCDGGLPFEMIYFLQERESFGLCSLDAAQSDDANTCGYGGCNTCAAGCLPYTEGNCLENSNEPDNVDFSNSQCSGDECICHPFTPAASCANPQDSLTALPSNIGFTYNVMDGHDFLSAAGRAAIQEWLLTHGSIAIGMDAGNSFAASGASPATCSDCNGQANHAVTIIGWTSVQGSLSWIVQNSWGPEWGDQGLFYIPMDSVGTCSGCFSIALPTGVIAGERGTFPTNNPNDGAPLTDNPPASEAPVASTSAAAPPPPTTTAAPAPPASTAAPAPAQTTEAHVPVSDTSYGGIDNHESPADSHEEDLSSHAPLGAEMAVSTRTDGLARAVVALVLSTVDSALRGTHHVAVIEGVTRQVVNGILYRSSVIVHNNATGHTRRVHSTIHAQPLRHAAGSSPSHAVNNTLQILKMHVSDPLQMAAVTGTTAASSSSNSNNSKSLGLGLGLGLGLTALVVAAVMVVLKVKAAAAGAVGAGGMGGAGSSADVLHERLLEDGSEAL